jgi:hypothetical protein
MRRKVAVYLINFMWSILKSVIKRKWYMVTRELYRQIQIVRGSLLGIAVLSVLQVLDLARRDVLVLALLRKRECGRCMVV